jgi:hypothetical protein
LGASFPVRRSPRVALALYQIIKLSLILGVPLLCLADNAREFVDRVNIWQRRVPLHEASIVP